MQPYGLLWQQHTTTTFYIIQYCVSCHFQVLQLQCAANTPLVSTSAFCIFECEARKEFVFAYGSYYFFVCSNYPIFRICNQPYIAFIYFLFIFVARRKKSPYHNWQRFSSTQPHGLRHFKFLAVTRAALCQKASKASDVHSFNLMLTILCGHVGYVAKMVVHTLNDKGFNLMQPYGLRQRKCEQWQVRLWVSILYSHSNCASFCCIANIPLLLPPAVLLISLSLLSYILHLQSTLHCVYLHFIHLLLLDGKRAPTVIGRGSFPRSRTGCDIFSFGSHVDCCPVNSSIVQL